MRSGRSCGSALQRAKYQKIEWSFSKRFSEPQKKRRCIAKLALSLTPCWKYQTFSCRRCIRTATITNKWMTIVFLSKATEARKRCAEEAFFYRTVTPLNSWTLERSSEKPLPVHAPSNGQGNSRGPIRRGRLQRHARRRPGSRHKRALTSHKRGPDATSGIVRNVWGFERVVSPSRPRSPAEPSECEAAREWMQISGVDKAAVFSHEVAKLGRRMEKDWATVSAQGGSPFDAVVRVALAHFLYFVVLRLSW